MLKTVLYSRVSGRHFKETMSVIVHGVARNGKSTFYIFNIVAGALGLIKGFEGAFCTANAHVGIYCNRIILCTLMTFFPFFFFYRYSNTSSLTCIRLLIHYLTKIVFEELTDLV